METRCDCKGVARRETERTFPSKPGKLAKDGKQSTPQPAMRINSRRNFKLSLNFLNIKIFLKLSKFP